MKSNRQHWSLTILILSITILLSACSTSSDVVSDNLLQKRKYRKGFHFNGHGKPIVKRGEAVVIGLPGSPENEGHTEVISSDNLATTAETYSKTKQVVAALSTNVHAHIEKLNSKADNYEFPLVIKQRKARNVEPFDEGEEEARRNQKDGLTALMLGIGAWVAPIILGVFSLISPMFFFLAMLGTLLGLILAILGLIFGIKSKRESTMGLVGFILSLVWLILFILYLVLLVLYIILIISLLGA